MTPARVRELLEAFRSRSILVAGDLMLDEFVWGRVSRISPEAPVPVVDVVREAFYPGGAANVARNLRPFCANVHILGMVGKDLHGERLSALLAEEGILLDGVIEDPGHRTILKTRIIARQQQVVRVDREGRTSPTPERIARALERVERLLPGTDAVVLEDYGKGFLCQELVTPLIERATARGVPVTVDPNPGNPLDWRGAAAVKPNRAEAFAAAGLSPTEPVDPPLEDGPLLKAGALLLQRWGVPSLLVTLGEDGMMLFSRDAPPHHTPTRAREVFDVSGAGDTAIALFTLALCAGATPAEAAEISNHASGVVVGKLGTATLTPEELLGSFDSHG